MSRGVVATIDSAALQHNFNFIRRNFPAQSILAMVKSNAYGHGLVSVARWLPDVDALGVACIEEVLKLRTAGINTPIVLMPGFSDPEELRLLAEYKVIPVIHDLFQIELLEKTTFTQPLSIWLKIDTGMHRLGFSPECVPMAYERLCRLAFIQKPLGLMTHLANADQDEAYTKQQIRTFFEITADYPGPKSVANSAGILHYPEARSDWIRPGIMLYGVSPFPKDTGEQQGLKPVMTLRAKLMATHFFKKGSPIGYGCTYCCPEDMPVGVVAVGYGDGYPRHAVSGTPVLVGGRRCALIGRVSMDMITIDLRPFPKAVVGEVVTLWGDGLPVEEIAESAGTIPYQLFCSLTARVKMLDR